MLLPPCDLSGNDYRLIHHPGEKETHEITLLSTLFLHYMHEKKKERSSMILRGLTTDDLITLRDWLSGIIDHGERVKAANKYKLPLT